jgi:serine/threonine-protein kinase HipA
VLETGIIQGGSFDASLDIALEACEFFDLTLEDAKDLASKIANIIASSWKQALRSEGCTSAEVRDYAHAFQHEGSNRALAI